MPVREPDLPDESPRSLVEVARERMRTRHFSLRTEQAHLQWIRRYVAFHHRKHPRELGPAHVEQFLTHLAVDRRVSAATQNQALQALLFLYRHVLGAELPWLDNITRATCPKHLPVVLSRAEVRSLLAQLAGAAWLVASLLYGTGLRLMEALRLRVKDVVLERRELIVREAKGGKDRVTMLPAALDTQIRAHIARLLGWYQEERRQQRPGVSLPVALARKYPEASTRWTWQYLFTARTPASPRRYAIMRAMPRATPGAAAGKPGAAAAIAADALRLKFCGLDFASPIVLLSGCVGFGEEYTRIEGFSNRDAGAIVLKGTTGKPRLGNPPHRVYETPAGMLNAIGLQNPGVESVVRDILPQLDFSETRFIANVCGSTLEEYVEVTRRFDQSPIDAVEINISCPNVKEGGVAFGNYPEMSARVVAACRAVTAKPLITKLSPNQTDIRENARRCIEAGSDALAVINTVMGMAVEVATRRPVIGNVQGGLSGPAIKPIALLKVHQVYEVARPHGVPIIGQGGIANATDALEFLIAGATAVGVGTALFYDPMVCKRINDGLAECLREQRIANVTQLIGTLRTGREVQDCAVSG